MPRWRARHTPPDSRGSQTAHELLMHYEVERELADRLRAAPREERRRLYAEVYRERSERIPHHPLVRQAADPATARAAAEPQLRLLRPWLSRDGTFLEVGAGDGAVARAVAPFVRHAIALDVTNALAGGDGPSNYEFREFDGLDVGLPDGSVAVAYSRDVAEHLHAEDFVDQTASVRRALRPGGVYLCVTPNRLSGPHDVSRHFEEVARGFHLHEYTATELAAALRRAGFRTVRIFGSYAGRRFTPLLPAGCARPAEAALGRLPLRARQRLTVPLAALKIAAYA